MLIVKEKKDWKKIKVLPETPWNYLGKRKRESGVPGLSKDLELRALVVTKVVKALCFVVGSRKIAKANEYVEINLNFFLMLKKIIT